MASNDNVNEEVEYYTEEEEVVEEVVEEVEEDEDHDGEDGAGENQSSIVQVQSEDARPAATNVQIPTARNSGSPQRKGKGKVVPSLAVANMKMGSPGTGHLARRPTEHSLSPTKNPFTTFGSWDAKTISEITVKFPDLTNKNETTNDLTRESRPEARFWKAPITFKYESFASETIRFNNVQIPYMAGVRNYGTSFVYICLPSDVGTAFAAAGKLKRPTMIAEKGLIPDNKRWWKAVNSIEEKFGSLDATTKNFVAKPLDAIFEATSRGITANVVLRFLSKAGTDNRDPLKPTTIGTIAVEIVRGYLVDVGVDVEGPLRVARQKKKIEPLAVASDVATDSLSKRLAELGI